MKCIFALTIPELALTLKEWKEPSFRAAQISQAVYNQTARDFLTIATLPISLRKKLNDAFYFYSLKERKRLDSADGTIKFLFSFSDKGAVESVLIPYEKRITACISTQVGCKFGCIFCASGSCGFTRNLEAGEIVQQIAYLQDTLKDNRISNIVFMGTGEPLDNYDNCLKAIRIINANDSFNIGARRITISTCGLPEQIKRLVSEDLQIELSVSLHAASDELRNELMPVNKKYPLKVLLEACRYYTQHTNRQVTFEYIVLEGINSSLQDARKLSTIVRRVGLAKINLIAANAVPEKNMAACPFEVVQRFKKHILDLGGFVTVRASRGSDIDAACGQLRMRHTP